LSAKVFELGKWRTAKAAGGSDSGDDQSAAAQNMDPADCGGQAPNAEGAIGTSRRSDEGPAPLRRRRPDKDRGSEESQNRAVLPTELLSPAIKKLNFLSPQEQAGDHLRSRI
jgi:hypothetical protein